MSEKMKHQRAPKRALKLDTVGAWRQSIPRSDRAYSKSRFPSGKMEKRLMDLEIVLTEVTCSWRFKELRRRQVQVTLEQLIQRDESSTDTYEDTFFDDFIHKMWIEFSSSFKFYVNEFNCIRWHWDGIFLQRLAQNRVPYFQTAVDCQKNLASGQRF